MSLSALRSIAGEKVDQLVRGDYDRVVEASTKSRLTAAELRTVIRNYGRTLVPPPSNAYEHLDAVQVKDAAIPTWSVHAPLWTKEEGRSNLTLELTIAFDQGEPSVELDDLHVL